tara:strand:- start:365 stop:682 length:318 start_codon:yes stop_codon:yes gene_type:complete
MTVNCAYWLEGFCQNHYYGGHPSKGTCEKLCPEYKVQQLTQDGSDLPSTPTKVETSRGLGDTVKKVIETVSFGKIKQKKDCGCKKRQEKLNEMFPYKDKGDADAT